jgi:adenosylcobinamide kinase/adenosylcobinamide-phosphate guanylyltransferase
VFVLTGSAASPWPEPGCCCVTCLAGAVPIGQAPLGLTVAGHPVDLDLAGGRTVEQSGVRVLGLPAAAEASSGTVVIGVAGRTLLWTGQPLTEEASAALTGAGVDGAVLDLRRQGRPHPVGLAHTLATLRRVGALGPAADVVVAGLDHRVRLDRLLPLLSAWGVRAAEPGTDVAPARAVTEHPAEPPRRTLVLGPAAAGKSAYAEALLAADADVVYLATAPSPAGLAARTGDLDPAWEQRIAAHRDRRPSWWQTVEDGDGGQDRRPGERLLALLAIPGPPLLVDSLGGWVTAVLGRCGAWEDERGWSERWQREVERMVDAWRNAARRVVVVGEETGWGVVPATASGRIFRDALGELSRRLAEQSERTELVVAGVPMAGSGEER